MKLTWRFLGAITIASFSSQPMIAVGHTRLQVDKAPANASLQLTTSIVQQDYCTGGDVRIFLRLHYTNTGKEPIILSRYSLTIAHFRISRSAEAAAKKRYEAGIDVFLQTGINQPNPTRGRTPPADRFVILAPRASYEIDTKILYSGFLRKHPESTEIQFPGVIYLDRSIAQGRLRKGNHVLQIKVPTWGESVSLAEELGSAWRTYGVLWWQGITSEPMPFKIEKPSATVKCSKNQRSAQKLS